jgi:hypothetical protein
MADPAVSVIGLNALRRDLGRLTADHGALDAAFAAAGAAVVSPVAATTRSEVPSATGRLASSVAVSAQPYGAGVAMGSSTVRYAGWLEFGGTRRAPHRSTRPYDPRGRYLFPAGLSVASTGPAIFESALNKALDGFPWSNETTDAVAVHD